MWDEAGQLHSQQIEAPPIASDVEEMLGGSACEEEGETPRTEVPGAAKRKSPRRRRVVETCDEDYNCAQTLRTSVKFYPKLGEMFALDALVPHDVDYWLSKEAIAILGKIITGTYDRIRDGDEEVYKLRRWGLIVLPNKPSLDFIEENVDLFDQIEVTKKGWQTHLLIRDVVEAAVHCMLTDMAGYLGFNVSVGRPLPEYDC